MRFNLLRPQGGLARKHVPAKLDLDVVQKRNLTDGLPPPPTPQTPAGNDPAKGGPGANAADPNTPPLPDNGPGKGKGAPKNGTEPLQPGKKPPLTPGKGPKKEKAPPTPPQNPTGSVVSGVLPLPTLPTPPTGAPPPFPTGTPSLPPPPPPSPPGAGPSPTNPPPTPRPKGNPPQRPPPMSTLSTSAIAVTAAPETVPTTASGGISSSSGNGNGAVVDSNAVSTPSSRSQSQATIAVSVVVIIIGSIAFITGLVFLARRIIRRRRRGLGKSAHLDTSPTAPPMQSFPAPQIETQYPPARGSSINYTNEQYTEAYAPVIMDGQEYNIRRKTVGARDEMGISGYEEMRLNIVRGSAMSEETLQNSINVVNGYPRDVKIPPTSLPREI